VKVDGKNGIFFLKTRKPKMTTGFLVRSLLGNSHLEGSENWNIKLKYVLRIMVCKVKYFHVY